MEVSFLWSWWSFFAGVGATVVFAFWLMLSIAFVQYRKQKKKAKAPVDQLLSEMAKWSGSGNK